MIFSGVINLLVASAPSPLISYSKVSLAIFLIPDFSSIIFGRSSRGNVSTFLPGKGWRMSCTSFKVDFLDRSKELSNAGTTLSTALVSLLTWLSALSLIAWIASNMVRLDSNIACDAGPAGFKPKRKYLSMSSLNPSDHLSSPNSEGALNFLTPLTAPVIPKLKRAPSVPNFRRLVNLRKASALPSLSSLSIMVIA